MFNRKLKKQSKSNFWNIIFSAVGMLLCVLSFKQMWMFAIFFALSIVFHVFFYIKNKKREKVLEEFLEPLEDEEEREKRLKKEKRKQENEELEKEHREFLNQLEEDFADDEYDDEE